MILSDDLYGEKTWELADSNMIQTALETAVQKVEKQLDDIEFLFGGDLINQIFPASFAARALGIPISGIYGAFGNFLNFDKNNINESLNRLQQIIEQKIEDLDFNVDEFEDAYMNLSSVSVNVGNVIRKGIFDYTLAALQGIKKSWYNCLINK